MQGELLLSYHITETPDLPEGNIWVHLQRKGKKQHPYLVLTAEPPIEGDMHLSIGCPDADTITREELNNKAYNLFISFTMSALRKARARAAGR